MRREGPKGKHDHLDTLVEPSQSFLLQLLPYHVTGSLIRDPIFISSGVQSDVIVNRDVEDFPEEFCVSTLFSPHQEDITLTS